MDGKGVMVKMIFPFKNVFPEITLLWLSGPLGEVQIGYNSVHLPSAAWEMAAYSNLRGDCPLW